MNHCINHERLEASGYCETCNKMFCLECSVDHLKAYSQHQLAFLAVITANLARRISEWQYNAGPYDRIEGTLDLFETEINKKIVLARETYEKVLGAIIEVIKGKMVEDISKLRAIQKEIKHTKDKTRNKRSKLIEIVSTKELLFKFYNGKEYDSILALQRNVNEFAEHAAVPEILQAELNKIELDNKFNLVNEHEKVMKQSAKYFKSLDTPLPIVYKPICSCCSEEMVDIKTCDLCFQYICSNCTKKCSKCENDTICKKCQKTCEKCNFAFCKSCPEYSSMTPCTTCKKLTCKTCQKVCLKCQKIICENCQKICSKCKSLVCNDCQKTCTKCMSVICKGCEATCNTYSNIICLDCLKSCAKCQSLICKDCQKTCVNCTKTFCVGCRVKCAKSDHAICNDCKKVCTRCNSLICQPCQKVCKKCNCLVCKDCQITCTKCIGIICTQCQNACIK